MSKDKIKISHLGNKFKRTMKMKDDYHFKQLD